MGELLSLFEKPKPSTKRVPRSYQQEFIGNWEKALATQAGEIAVAAPGLGKTFMAAMVARPARRVLFMVNRDHLREQSMTTLQQDSGKPWTIEQGDLWAPVDGQASVVALVQSLIRPHPVHGHRFKRFPADAFDVVIIDEVHKMMGEEYRAPAEYFQLGGAKILGFTGTPAGVDYQPLITSQVFDFPLARSIKEAWALGFELRVYNAKVDLDGVPWSGGDWSRKALDDVMAHAAAAVAKAAIEECDDLKTLIFLPGINAVEAVTDAINKLQPGTARCLHSKLSDTEKRGTRKAFENGEFQRIVSCDMIREGFDDVNAAAVVLARPMGQLHDYIQIISRGSRILSHLGDIVDMEERRAAIAASAKPVCRVIDLACVSEQHDVMTIMDALGGDYTKREKDLANKAAKGKPSDKSGTRKEAGQDPIKLLEWARRELEFRDAMAEQAKKAKVELKRKEKANPAGPPSADMLRKMAEFSIPIREGMTHDEVNKVLRYEYLCRSKGWCNFKQRAWIEKNCGVRDARQMTVARGTELAALYKKRRGIG